MGIKEAIIAICNEIHNKVLVNELDVEEALEELQKLSGLKIVKDDLKEIVDGTAQKLGKGHTGIDI